MRRAFEASGDQAQASLADYENVLLSLKADVATNYFAVCAPPTRKSMCSSARIESYQDNLNLTNSRFQGGISTQLDVEQAEATLAAAQAQLATLQQNRAQLEHALAVLLGMPPEGFSHSLPPARAPASGHPGRPALGLARAPARCRRSGAPRRRPERADRRRHRRLFPLCNLTGQTGFDSGDLGMLFNWESRIWSYGPNIQFPIFEGGQISANVKQQRAAYEENVANYRQSVLVAFQDVEDSLSSLRYLAATGRRRKIAPSRPTRTRST